MPKGAEVDRIKEAARRFASGFTAGQKAMTGLALIAVVVGAVVFMKVAGKPSYQPLFTNLQGADAGAITAKLSSSKVPYQLADNGGTILVPASQVNQQRIDMAQAGLPSSGTVGLSLLDKEGLTTSQLTQQADYQRAVQGELESTIESIQGVTGAQVNLVMPPTDAFAVSNSTTASASVLVDLQPGATLTSSQVQAIVHLVSSAVANLDPSDVTVVDSSGNMLAGPGVDASASGGTGQTASYDAALAAAIGDMLTKVVGPGKADVKVNADLDFDQVSTTSKGVQTGPNGAPLTAPTSTSTSNETYAGAPPAGAAGGTLGQTAATTGSQNGNYNKQTSDTSYATGEVDQTVKQAPGTVRHLSVAVLLDSSVKGVDDNSVRQLVSAAAGMQTSRGDTLSVVRMPFSNAPAQEAKAAAAAAAAAKSKAEMSSILRTVAPLLVIVMALALISRVLRRPRVVSLPLPSAPFALEAGSTEAGAGAEAVGGTAIGALELGDQPAVASSPSRIEDFIEQQPDEVARLLRGWMTTDKVGSGA